MAYKDIIKGLAVLLSIAITTAIAVNFFSPKRIAFFGEWDTSRGVITAKPKDDFVVHELEIEDMLTAKEIYDRGDAIFVDARAAEEFKDGHIKGAVSLPPYRLEEFIDKFKDEFPTYMMIVTYCSGRECDDSHMLAQYLLREGYTDIRVFIDGYSGWKKVGYPIEHL